MKRTSLTRKTWMPRVSKKYATKPRAGRLKGDDLGDLRRQCWERDGGLCQECGCYTIYDAPSDWLLSYHMAHIQAKRMGGDSLDNVRTLCGKCHRTQHAYGPSMTKPVPRKVRDEDPTQA
jgi:5-methylcytosine-specific restriction endonuclease McrA